MADGGSHRRARVLRSHARDLLAAAKATAGNTNHQQRAAIALQLAQSVLTDHHGSDIGSACQMGAYTKGKGLGNAKGKGKESYDQKTQRLNQELEYLQQVCNGHIGAGEWWNEPQPRRPKGKGKSKGKKGKGKGKGKSDGGKSSYGGFGKGESTYSSYGKGGFGKGGKGKGGKGKRWQRFGKRPTTRMLDLRRKSLPVQLPERRQRRGLKPPGRK